MISKKRKIVSYIFLFLFMCGLAIFSWFLITGRLKIGAATEGYQWPTTQHFPSAKTFGYISDAGSPSDYTWEGENYDFVNSSIPEALVAHKTANSSVTDLDYTFLTIKCPTDSSGVVALYDYAEASSLDPEDMFIHLSENSSFKMESEGGFFAHDRFYRAYQYANGNYYHQDDWHQTDRAFTFGNSIGEILNLGMLDKFDEANFLMTTKAAGGWNGVWEYWNGLNWVSLNISDSTNTFRQDGKVTWQPPSDWKRTTVNQEKAYYVRIRVTGTGTAPTFNSSTGLRGATFISLTDSTNKIYQYLGWDETADLNHDGYLNPAEYANRTAGKDARWKWWSRFPGRHLVDPWSWRTNTSSPVFRAVMLNYLVDRLTTDHNGYSYNGIYFDELSSGINQFLFASIFGNPRSGGSVYEFSLPGSDQANTEYNSGTLAFLATIQSTLHSLNKVVSGVDPNWVEAHQYMDVMFMESAWYSQSSYDQIYKSSTYSTVTGLNNGHNANLKVLLQYQQVLERWLGTEQQVIDRSKYLGLATFYTLQQPSSDYFRSWTGIYYTSSKSSASFVPAVKTDIGVPTSQLLGYPAITTLNNGAFLFASGSDPSFPSTDPNKQYKVVGRDYTKALVLSRPKTNFAPDDSTIFSDTSAVTLNLPGTFYKVEYDGSISTTSITSISLRNSEGAILIKESAMQNVVLDVNADKATAQQGDTITYTINYQVGAKSITAVKIEDPIPANTSFVSAANGGTSDGSIITWNLGNISAGGNGSVSFQVRVQ